MGLAAGAVAYGAPFFTKLRYPILFSSPRCDPTNLREHSMSNRAKVYFAQEILSLTTS